MQIRIEPDGEILVGGRCVMLGYKNRPEATAEAISDGWLKTGDMGFVDSDGFLTITDRKKDLIKTSGGKYVAPLPIESQLENDRYVKASLVVGDQRPYVVALIVPDWEALRADNGLPGEPGSLANDRRPARPFLRYGRPGQHGARELRDGQVLHPSRPRLHRGRGRADSDVEEEAPRYRRALPGPDRRDVLLSQEVIEHSGILRPQEAQHCCDGKEPCRERSVRSADGRQQ